MNKALLLFFFFCQVCWAHPVIYQGGWVLSTANMPTNSTNTLAYSFTSRFAAGIEHWRFDKTDVGFLKLNHLLYRLNGEDSQANLYLHGGFGTQTTGLAGVEADWETRRLYGSLKHYEFHSPYGFDRSMSQARLGVAPYLASFSSLQTWVMVQAMHMREVEDEVLFTPMLRFFYHNVLWEMGSSIKGAWMFNLMVHY